MPSRIPEKDPSIMIRIAINGYGRIGRCVLRAIFERGLDGDIEIAAINDLTDFDLLTHLTRFDSTHGRFAEQVSRDGDSLDVGGRKIALYAEKDPARLPWKSLGVDVVLECSGRFKQRDQLQTHLDAGAPRVLASHPVADADRTVVYGVNHESLTAEDRIVSNASCTTNCLAPLVMALDEAFGLEQGQMTTIHAYTNDQNLLDKTHKDIYRARAAAINLVPTSTGAAKAVGLVLPHLKGKLDGMAVRAPVANMSMVDLHALLAREVTQEEVIDALRQAAAGKLKNVLAMNDLPLVSSDLNHRPESSIVDTDQIRAMGRQIKVMSWYDNEWGFTNRMLDVLALMRD